MIALNETNEYAAEVAFNLPLSSDPITGLTGYTFTLGEVQIKLPGQAWADATLAKIVEKGYGRFAVRLTNTQTTVAGDVFVRATVSGTQNYFGGDVIGVLGGDIPVAGEGSVSFFLPDENDPINGAPLTGHTFVLGEVRMCLPNSVYADVPLVQIEEIGYGGYVVNLTATDTATRGKVFIYANVTGYQPFEGYGTILGVGVAPTSTTSPTPIPVPESDLAQVAITMDLITGAVNRLCEYAKSGDFDLGVFTDNVGV
jgi:hypothetical protein